LIENGTTEDQKVRRLCLKELAVILAAEKTPSPRKPVLLVVGAVCAFRVSGTVKSFFELAAQRDAYALRVSENGARHPLRIVVTRPEPKNTEMCREINALGGKAIPFPCIKLLPLENWAAGSAAELLQELALCQWLVFTSAPGVHFFFEGCLCRGIDLRAFSKNRFAVVGPGTAEALTRWGFIPDFISPVFNGEALGRALTEKTGPGETLLLIRALESAPHLTAILSERGISFRELAVYDSVPAEGGEAARRIITEGCFDFVFFTSPKTVLSFASRFSCSGIQALCIGQSTAEKAREFGMETHTPAEASAKGLYQLAAELESAP
jgi:uroporphyrinogen III methyltransferase/synthase